MKSIKKTLSILLTLCLLMALVSAVPHAHADHTHAYGGPWITDLEPTCTAVGRRYNICTASGCSDPPSPSTMNCRPWGIFGAPGDRAYLPAAQRPERPSASAPDAGQRIPYQPQPWATAGASGR